MTPKKKQKIELTNFLKYLTEKNYAKANEFLKKIAETKMKQKIAAVAQ